jgi:hypothetical protein
MSPDPQSANVSPQVSEKYLIAFVIQGDDVFKITADNIIHTIGTADGPAFDAIAKLKAAAALLELTNRHKERPEELKKMAKELAGEGMKLMARASSSIRAMPAPEPEEEMNTPETQANLAQVAAALNAMPIPPASGPRAVPAPAAASGQAISERPRPMGPAPLPVSVPAGEDRGSSIMPNSSRIALISS